MKSRKKTIGLSLIACICFPVYAQGQSLELSEDGRVILREQAGPDIARPCSRPGPDGGVNGYWRPTVEDLDLLEARLIDYFDSREASGLQIPPQRSAYDRQYFGLTRGGVRLIYGNYFPSSMRTNIRSFDFSPSNAVTVCDGGPSFWGIIYNTATGEFSELAFNGVT